MRKNIFYIFFIVIGITANITTIKLLLIGRPELFHLKSTGSKVAFATVTTPAFCMGAVALGYSIQKYHGDSIDRICLVSHDVNSTWREILSQWWKVYEMPEIKPTKTHRRSWIKLQLWKFTDYSKILYFDTDTLLLDNVEELFKEKQLSCANDVNPTYICNTGVLVLEPSILIYRDMLEKMKDQLFLHLPGDQAFINAYFKTFNPLHPKYNALRLDSSSFLEFYEAGKLKVVHYVCKKPWKCGRSGVTYCGCGYAKLNEVWYQYFDEACKNHTCIESWKE